MKIYYFLLVGLLCSSCYLTAGDMFDEIMKSYANEVTESETFDNAIMKSDVNEVKRLINNGVNVNVQNNSKDSPLYVLTLKFGDLNKSDLEIAELLINNGADVNFKDSTGRTPLHSAVDIPIYDKKNEDNKLQLMQLLINNGADVNAKDNNGKTPLHIAAGRGKLGEIKLLINNGADVNAADSYASTPLSRADKLEVVQLLIKNGANVNALDKKAFELKKNKQLNEIPQYLQLFLDSLNAYQSAPLKFNEKDKDITLQLLFDNIYYRSDQTDEFANLAAQYYAAGKMDKFNKLVKNAELWRDTNVARKKKLLELQQKYEGTTMFNKAQFGDIKFNYTNL